MNEQKQNVLVSGGGLDSAALLYAIALGFVGNNEQPHTSVHIDYGQTSARPEREAVRELQAVTKDLLEYKTGMHHIQVGAHTPKRYNPDSLLFGGAGSAFIRGRNLWLLTIAAGDAIAQFGTKQQIVLNLGFCVETMMFDDANEGFVADADALFERSYGKVDAQGQTDVPLIRVKAPVMEAGYKKLDIFQTLFKALKNTHGEETADHLLFKVPFTCWTPEYMSKGQMLELSACGACYHCTKLTNLRREVVFGKNT